MAKKNKIKRSLDDFIKRFPELESIKENMWEVFLEMVKTYENGGKVLVCGNGGSAADAAHIVAELMKSFMFKRELKGKEKYNLPWISKDDSNSILNQLEYGLPAVNLCAHIALNTAFANDVNSDLIFAQQVFVLGKQNDLFIGISTSGNSKNVYMEV